MKKKIPAFKSARAAAAFVDKADLSQYDLSGAQTVRFEMKRDACGTVDRAACIGSGRRDRSA